VETDTSINDLLALLRQYERADKKAGKKNAELDSPAPKYDGTGATPTEERRLMQKRVLAAMGRHDFDKMSDRQKLDATRVYALAFSRLGAPDMVSRTGLIRRFDAIYPSGDPRLDLELTQLLVYLQAASAASKGVTLLEQAPTQEEQIAYAKSLRLLREGWTPELRERYFKWFNERAAGYAGGNSFEKFLDYIRSDAVAGLSGAEKAAVEKGLNAKPKAKTAIAKKSKRTSALDAAAKVLAEASEPLNTKQMIEAMAEKGYWTSPGGKTPHATLYSAILREIQNKGADSRFKKVDRGQFTIHATKQEA